MGVDLSLEVRRDRMVAIIQRQNDQGGSCLYKQYRLAVPNGRDKPLLLLGDQKPLLRLLSGVLLS